MKPLPNFSTIPASTDRGRLPVGGYVLKITGVEDNVKMEYLRVIYDIAEGPEKGRYSDEWANEHIYAHAFIRSYKETARGMFKAWLVAVDESNGTKFVDTVEAGLKETQLVGKVFGAVIGEEEYKTDLGDIKTRLYVASVMSADRIRKGDYKLPAFKPYKDKAGDGMKPAPTVTFSNPLNEDDLPF